MMHATFIDEAIDELSSPCTRMTPEAAGHFIARTLSGPLAPPALGHFLWERLEGRVSFHAGEGCWRLMRELPIAPIVLWLDPEEDLAAWRCPTPKDLVAVLAETPHFEFFVSDADATFVACINHHGSLIGWKSATEWVRGLAGELAG